ncbi:hypothetical protein COCMIDRAFT_10429 [Bipolaris oryzae ATCC 44560]|uniref:Uncharacterized protein n=1 Tax=Bipolaris oryzae ATCC 44560 TaxID=930090 RepID=W6YPM9_COCMI|nr:uncharacterized protein COCMIDRAFT_10429 [Bipolaris oryzae ATCC 44560]EUC39483.1 hypothetical protein COCMIDRAFT_10429 [Bipolaris oryzae ATCC 44560]
MYMKTEKLIQKRKSTHIAEDLSDTYLNEVSFFGIVVEMSLDLEKHGKTI